MLTATIMPVNHDIHGVLHSTSILVFGYGRADEKNHDGTGRNVSTGAGRNQEQKSNRRSTGDRECMKSPSALFMPFFW